MGYRIDIDHGGCINCGICMDVCPVEALDMSRPERPGRRRVGARRATTQDGLAADAAAAGKQLLRLDPRFETLLRLGDPLFYADHT